MENKKAKQQQQKKNNSPKTEQGVRTRNTNFLPQ